MTAVEGHGHAENPHAGRGTSVLLDIGGDVGAVVVEMPAAMTGLEVEIVPAVPDPSDAHGHAHHPHVAVVDRPVGDRWVPSLVFGEVREGSYVLVHKGRDTPRAPVEVRGGEVTWAVWPG